VLGVVSCLAPGKVSPLVAPREQIPDANGGGEEHHRSEHDKDASHGDFLLAMMIAHVISTSQAALADTL
jgi:hypothetical protein